jgi:hypothetical protein
MAVYKINKEVLLQEDFEFLKKQIEARRNGGGSSEGGLLSNPEKFKPRGGFGSGIDTSKSLFQGLGNIADRYKKRQQDTGVDPFKPLPYSRTGHEPAYSSDHAVPVGH